MDGADQRLVGERQQVLDRAAAAGDDDDVDLGMALQAAERLHHLGGRALALHGGVGDLEGDIGPAAPGVVEHVALGGGLRRGDQPDPVGEERQRPLQLAGEQPLGREQLPAPLEPGQQLAEADHPDLADREGERAAVGVVGRLGLDHHARPLDQRRRQAVDPVRRGTVSGMEMSATESRSVMNTVWIPGRRLIWAIWPSTQTAPSRSTYWETRLAIWRTGAGDCADVSRGMRGL